MRCRCSAVLRRSGLPARERDTCSAACSPQAPPTPSRLIWVIRRGAVVRLRPWLAARSRTHLPDGLRLRRPRPGPAPRAHESLILAAAIVGITTMDVTTQPPTRPKQRSCSLRSLFPHQRFLSYPYLPFPTVSNPDSPTSRQCQPLNLNITNPAADMCILRRYGCDVRRYR